VLPSAVITARYLLVPIAICSEVPGGTIEAVLGSTIRAFSQWLIVSTRVACRSSFVVRQSLQRHPVVLGSGTCSACGRSEHQQLCPGLQDMGVLHLEQNVFMVDLQFSLRWTIGPPVELLAYPAPDQTRAWTFSRPGTAP
jgi:hypothetical protein